MGSQRRLHPNERRDKQKYPGTALHDIPIKTLYEKMPRYDISLEKHRN